MKVKIHRGGGSKASETLEFLTPKRGHLTREEAKQEATELFWWMFRNLPGITLEELARVMAKEVEL